MSLNAKEIKEKVIENLSKEKIYKKLKMAQDLYVLAYEVKKQQLKKKYPNLSEQEINHKVYALIERGCR